MESGAKLPKALRILAYCLPVGRATSYIFTSQINAFGNPVYPDLALARSRPVSQPVDNQMTEPGFIYFVTIHDPNNMDTDDLDFVKIGYASDPHARLAVIQSSMPFVATMDWWMPGNRADERALHAKFAAHRKRGEWFHWCDEIRDFIDEMVEAVAILRPVDGSYDPSIKECLAH